MVARVLASFATAYSGSYDRIQNLRLAAKLIDGTRIAPGATFSFNEVVGPRTAKRGFRMAPTILEGEYKDALGGVSQVATTTFNAAWEAGLDITQRNAHSLHQPLPARARCDRELPDVDLKFKNDTKNWIVMRGQSGDTGITISLLGAPTNRRVVSEAGELRVTGPPEVESTPDPTLSRESRWWRTSARALAVGDRRADRLPGRRGALARDLDDELRLRAEDRPRGHDSRPGRAAAFARAAFTRTAAAAETTPTTPPPPTGTTPTTTTTTTTRPRRS